MLTFSERLLLIAIHGKETTTRELSESIGMKIGTVRAYVGSLKRKELVKQRVDGVNHYLSLTEEGKSWVSSLIVKGK